MTALDVIRVTAEIFDQAGDHGVHALDTCARPGCRKGFLDRSRAGNREFCSISCANRAHVSAFRERKRILNQKAG